MKRVDKYEDTRLEELKKYGKKVCVCSFLILIACIFILLWLFYNESKSVDAYIITILFLLFSLMIGPPGYEMYYD